jgi:2-polyprenyl-3-methyl-5-hydroxy-6-metoxy-1,4-benzoquinol methylase
MILIMEEFWNNRYAEKDFAYGTEPNDFLKDELGKIPAGNILFVCEGEGRNAVFAAKQNWIVEAFDLSEEGKRKASLLAKQNNVFINYQIANASTIEYPENSFHVVALIYAHFPETIRKSVHEKIVRWLKPGGLVVLEAFNPNQLNNTSGGPKDLSMLYTKEIMADDFKELIIQQLNTETIELNEGKYHTGKAEIIRFIGKKINK